MQKLSAQVTHWYMWRDVSICAHICSYVWHDSSAYVTWLVHMCDMTHSYVARRIDMRTHLFICVTWLIRMCDVTRSHVWRDSFICGTTHPYAHPFVTWLVHMCDVTDLYVWRDWFICVPWPRQRATISRLLKTVDLFCKRALWKRLYSAEEVYTFKEPTNRGQGSALAHAWILYAGDSLVYVARRIDMCTHVWRDLFICVTWLVHTCDVTHLYVARLIRMCTHLWRALFICVTWRAFIRTIRPARHVIRMNK